MKNFLTTLLCLFLISSPALAAMECAQPNAVCALLQKCISDTESRRIDDRAAIIRGIGEENGGGIVHDGLQACTNDMKLQSAFKSSTPGCTNPNYKELAEQAQKNQCGSDPKFVCATMESNNRLVIRGDMGAVGICTGQLKKGALCKCGTFIGQVY